MELNSQRYLVRMDDAFDLSREPDDIDKVAAAYGLSREEIRHMAMADPEWFGDLLQGCIGAETGIVGDRSQGAMQGAVMLALLAGMIAAAAWCVFSLLTGGWGR